MLLTCCTQYVCKFGKLSSGHRTGKVSFHSNPKKGNAKERLIHHTTVLLSHTSKVMFKIPQARLQQYLPEDSQMNKLVLGKANESEIKLPTFIGS